MEGGGIFLVDKSRKKLNGNFEYSRVHSPKYPVYERIKERRFKNQIIEDP